MVTSSLLNEIGSAAREMMFGRSSSRGQSGNMYINHHHQTLPPYWAIHIRLKKKLLVSEGVERGGGREVMYVPYYSKHNASFSYHIYLRIVSILIPMPLGKIQKHFYLLWCPDSATYWNKRCGFVINLIFILCYYDCCSNSSCNYKPRSRYYYTIFFRQSVQHYCTSNDREQLVAVYYRAYPCGPVVFIWSICETPSYDYGHV